MSHQYTPSYDFVVKQGATFARTIKFRSRSTGELQSLDSLVSVTLTARPDSADAFTLTHDGPSDRHLVLDYLNKEIRIYIADEVTASYDWKKAPFEIDVMDSAGDISRKLRGNLVLERRVS